MLLIGAAFQFFLIPALGALSDRVGRRPLYLVGAVGVASGPSCSSACSTT